MRLDHNPLNPTYKLQSVQYLNPDAPKFIRDQQYIDDIPGTRPTKKKQLDIKTRDLMNITDIEGTKARQRHPSRPNPEKTLLQFNPMDYRDVTNVDFKTKRTVNPLMPTYTIRDEDKNLVQIGSIIGNVPCALPPARQDQEFMHKSLKTTDLHGCKTGTKGLGNFHTRERREWKNTNITTDIFGA